MTLTPSARRSICAIAGELAGESIEVARAA